MRWQQMRKFWGTAAMIAGLLLVTRGVFADSEYKVIKDPKPNMKEKNFVALEKVDEITDEVAKDVFLFSPYSMAMDERNNLYVYDLMQAKILQFDRFFKFIKSFGGAGAGPGEFLGKGKGHSVFINFGLDKNLYAYDWMARKVSIFDTDGKFYKHINISQVYGSTIDQPVVDSKGNLLLQNFLNDQLVFFNLKGETLFSIAHKEKKKEILFIEDKMADPRAARVWENMLFYYRCDELQMKLAKNSSLLVYFPLSATMQVINLKDKKLVKKFNVWPEEAIKLRRSLIFTLKSGYWALFQAIIMDGDQDNIFYLDFLFRTKQDHRHYLYKMNLDGELLEVLFLENEKASNSFMLKQNNLFFAICEDKIVIYKEIKK